MTNLTDVTVTSSLTINGYYIDAPTATVLTANGTITSANEGVVVLNKATAITVTLTNPTATTDDGKRLHFVSLTDVAHVINQASGFGKGGAGENVSTFSGIRGDGLHLIAWQGYWYITGNYQTVVD